MIKHSLLVTNKQNEELLEQAKLMGVEDMADFFSKLLCLGKIYCESLKDGWEFVMIKKDVECYEEDQSNKRAIVGSKQSILFVDESIKETLEIDNKVKVSNSFGAVRDLEYKA